MEGRENFTGNVEVLPIRGASGGGLSRFNSLPARDCSDGELSRFKFTVDQEIFNGRFDIGDSPDEDTLGSSTGSLGGSVGISPIRRSIRPLSK